MLKGFIDARYMVTTFVAVVQNLETVAVDIGWQLAQYSAASSQLSAAADVAATKIPRMLVSPQCQVGLRMLRAAYGADKQALIHYVEVGPLLSP
jgi:hypothetical protein